ncbi:indole-3-glycerol phosphate synthase TrpC [Paenibacillus lemnae]|uniref:Indole-3-glycerol phosphate synthase n=1 Tax=Paenibacillus lemnae TaxID=1330551 RepID=A0A848M9Y8_PAELE|nr:indole-3-glycerol phosphate synthase TrpC [Paenibacillus lemnae]NMO96980.1 indole-3-glycerol phosphate synthase TrpC [Paenibacillus lemnae]
MYLDRIVATKREEMKQLYKSFTIESAMDEIKSLPPTRGFADALIHRRNRAMGLIAEVKKASPSKGLIRPDFDPVTIAKAYESAGADCLSVLTDVEYFQGSSQYLKDVRAAVNLPLLRKDFVIDEAQIYEARLLGADAILLIAAILTPSQMTEFMSAAHSLGLDCLVEVHDRDELDTVLKLDQIRLVGINNRNLRTFETSLNTTSDLSSAVPEHITLISESGISQTEDIAFLSAAGAQGVLVGEHFMRKPDVSQAVYDLMGPLNIADLKDSGADAV